MKTPHVKVNSGLVGLAIIISYKNIPNIALLVVDYMATGGGEGWSLVNAAI